MRSWLMTTASKYITSDRDCFWFAWSDDFPFRQILGFPTFDFERASDAWRHHSAVEQQQKCWQKCCCYISHSASLRCVTIERCPKELPSTNTISQLIQDTSTFSKLIVAAKWRLILFRSLSENESRSFLHLFSWIRKNNKDLCVYECMWNAHSLSDRLWSPPQPSLNPTFEEGVVPCPGPTLCLMLTQLLRPNEWPPTTSATR